MTIIKYGHPELTFYLVLHIQCLIIILFLRHCCINITFFSKSNYLLYVLFQFQVFIILCIIHRSIEQISLNCLGHHCHLPPTANVGPMYDQCRLAIWKFISFYNIKSQEHDWARVNFYINGPSGFLYICLILEHRVKPVI